MASFSAIQSRLQRLGLFRLPTMLTGQLGWVVVPFVGTQAIRLGSSIVLAHLLAPEFFGLMLLVNTLRMGAELLSDIGIGQSVVLSKNAEDQEFLNVAWTLQIIRGLLLTACMAIAAAPIADLYNQPELLPIILVVSPVFILAGLQSPGMFTIQRKLLLKRRATFDLAGTFFQAAFTIVLAMIMPSVWALVIGLVASAIFNNIMSFVIAPGRFPRLQWRREYAAEIFSFGKWIFLSTAVYFGATSFDRMYFVGALPIALAGVYGIARSFSDLIGSLAQHTGSVLVFPKMASFRDRRLEMAPRVRKARRLALLLVALASGVAIAGLDQFILLAYDPRYHAAAFISPLLMVSVWFGILSSFADSMLMGCGRPAPGAFANAAKFATLLVGLPLALTQGSMFEALLVLILAEIVRWIALIPASHGERFARVTDDLELTVVMVLTALGVKFALGGLGLVPTLSEWWAMRGLLHV